MGSGPRLPTPPAVPVPAVPVPPAPVPPAPVSYGRRFSDLARERPREIAVVFAGSDGRDAPVTWTELDHRAVQTAQFLMAQGVGLGDLVVVGLGSSPEHAATTIGAWKLGACVLPVRHDLPPWERDRLLAVADPRIVVADWSGADVTRRDVAATDGEPSPGAPLPDVVAPRAQAIASSGSTGRPKLIMSPTPGQIVVDPSTSMLARYGLAPTGQRHLIPAPLYHTNGFACYRLLLGGEPIVLMEAFDAARAIDLIERHRISAMIAVPTMLMRMARLPDIAGRDLSSIESLIQGGASMPPWLARFWIERIGPERYWSSYGSTEGVGLASCRGDEWLAHPGTVGRGTDTEIRILDTGTGADPDSARRLLPGEIGEIFLRSTAAFVAAGATAFEYVNAPPPPRTEDGFTSIGDLGWLDDDEYLYIADRRVDMIITGGVNVFPAEVEAALTEHPDVADAVVIGLPDPEWGHRVHAIVVTDIGASDLALHCRERLSGAKVPKSFEIVDGLPRSAAGKINRSALVAEREVADPG